MNPEVVGDHHWGFDVRGHGSCASCFLCSMFWGPALAPNPMQDDPAAL